MVMTAIKVLQYCSQSSIISSDTYKMRQRYHAFSVSGQMVHFLAELLYTLLASIGLHMRHKEESFHMHELLLVFKDMTFAITAFVQVMASSDIRSEFLNYFRRE